MKTLPGGGSGKNGTGTMPVAMEANAPVAAASSSSCASLAPTTPIAPRSWPFATTLPLTWTR